MSETIVVPDNGNNNMNNAWPWMFAGNNGFGGFGGGNFWGAGIGAFLGSALGNWFGGNGNGFGGNNGGAAAASLGAQATANQNTELLRAAISSNGEQSRQAIQTVSTMLGQDFATVSAQFGAINGILNNMAIQNATTPLQIINAIVGGNKDLQAEFANTWFHELIHCSMHIARENGLSPDGEAVAYVGGELARSMQPIAARLMCPTCDC